MYISLSLNHFSVHLNLNIVSQLYFKKQNNNEENSTMIIFPLLKFSAKVIGTFQTTKPQISSF